MRMRSCPLCAALSPRSIRNSPRTQFRRSSTSLLGAFAALGLVLAAVGIYGVMSFSVASRTREIGIRMALGADAVAVRRRVVLQASGLIAAGLMVGLAGSFALRQAISGL